MNEHPKKDDSFLLLKKFRFKSTKTNRKYIVNIEEYNHHVYAIKFFCKNDSSSPNKYKILTGDNEPRTIIYTCFNILKKEVIDKDPRSSFGFIAERSVGEKNKKDGSKRFSVYRRLVSTAFGDKTFEHHHETKSQLSCLKTVEQCLTHEGVKCSSQFYELLKFKESIRK